MPYTPPPVIQHIIRMVCPILSIRTIRFQILNLIEKLIQTFRVMLQTELTPNAIWGSEQNTQNRVFIGILKRIQLQFFEQIGITH